MSTTSSPTQDSVKHPDASARDVTPLAWCGWQMMLPEDWRPNQIEGTFVKGRMFVGDESGPFFAIRWWRPGMEGEKNFSFQPWLKARFKKLHADPQPNAPCPPGFTKAAWVKDLQTKQEKSRTIWYGYVQKAGVLIELLMTSLTPEDTRQQIVKEIMPSLRVVTRKDPIPWSLFTVHFESPPGFILEDRHLFSGDVALRFTRDKESLLVRTVYPASLALSRRKLGLWLQEPPFLERRSKGSLTANEWNSGGDPDSPTVLQQGWKRYPIPLGWLKPRYSTALVTVDADRDRLLIADHQMPEEHSSRLAEQAIHAMREANGI